MVLRHQVADPGGHSERAGAKLGGQRSKRAGQAPTARPVAWEGTACVMRLGLRLSEGAESHWTLPYESRDFALSMPEGRACLVYRGRFRTLPNLDEVPVALKWRVAGFDDLIYTCGYAQHVGRKPDVQAIFGGFRCPAYPAVAVLSRRFCGRNYVRLQTMLYDVPSPIDLRVMSDAREWESTALSKRPWRPEFFAEFAKAIQDLPHPEINVLELGSGPGFLAENLLNSLPSISYVALDFSPSMHQLAAERLGPLATRVQFIERSFRAPEWSQNLGMYQAIVTNQAVHELRHKRYAHELHAKAKELLVSGGAYLVCDHFVGDGRMSNDQLYMTVVEQFEALTSAGFSRVEQLLIKGGLVLHRAT